MRFRWTAVVAVIAFAVAVLFVWRAETCDVANVEGRVVHWSCD